MNSKFKIGGAGIKNAITSVANSSGSTVTNQAKDLAKKSMNKGEELKNKATDLAKGATNAVKDKVDNAQKKISEIADKTGIKGPLTKWTSMSQDFLKANTAISKFVMFMLAILLFLILFQLGSGLLQYIFGPNYNPFLINGMVSSNIVTQVFANPNTTDSVPIYRSVDAPQGIEYTWNVWFIVNNIGNTTETNPAMIFSKGAHPAQNTATTGSNGLNPSIASAKYINASPGLFLAPDNNANKLILVMNTFDQAQIGSDYYETITIKNIPMNKWVCCTIRVQGTYVDVYINGILSQRKILMNPPKQNYYDTYIGDVNGFSGYISTLRYYANAINYDQIQTLFASGPSMTMVSSATMPKSNDFLSMDWFYKYTPNT